MLKNELFKYKLIKHTLEYFVYVQFAYMYFVCLYSVEYPECPCGPCQFSLCRPYSLSLLKSKVFQRPGNKVPQLTLDLAPETTSHGKDTLLLSASIRDTFGFSSSSKTPAEQTKDFESYIGALLEHQIIGDPQLIRFIESLEKGKLINPISEEEARMSTASLIQRGGLQQHLDKASLTQKELLNWASATLEKRARVRVRREETQEETRHIYQPLEFHPVKRPVKFEMRYGDDKKIATLTYPIEVQSTPVTQNQWVEIMGENPSEFAKGKDSAVWTFNGKPIKLQPDNPVEKVTWWSALVFATDFRRNVVSLRPMT